MASICLDKVSVAFPVYDAATRSLKKRLVAAAVGGPAVFASASSVAGNDVAGNEVVRRWTNACWLAKNAENCERLRSYLRALEGGFRIARVNAAGQQEVLDDAGRAAETTRTRSQIEQNCN